MCTTVAPPHTLLYSRRPPDSPPLPFVHTALRDDGRGGLRGGRDGRGHQRGRGGRGGGGAGGIGGGRRAHGGRRVRGGGARRQRRGRWGRRRGRGAGRGRGGRGRGQDARQAEAQGGWVNGWMGEFGGVLFAPAHVSNRIDSVRPVSKSTPPPECNRSVVWPIWGVWGGSMHPRTCQIGQGCDFRFDSTRADPFGDSTRWYCPTHDPHSARRH